MSGRFVLGLVLAAASLAGCAADDTRSAVPTSEEKTELTSPGEPGFGGDVPAPAPMPPVTPAPEWQPPPDREHDPMAPAGECLLTYQAIYDPSRGKPIEVPIVRCE